MFDMTEFLQETISGLNDSIVSNLLASDAFNLVPGSIVFWIFMICLVWQFTLIFIDFADSGVVNYKKGLNTVVAVIVVFYAYGKFNPRSIPAFDFGIAGTEYDYNGTKTLLRDTHGLFRKLFADFATNVTGSNKLTKGDSSDVLVKWTQQRSYVETLCEGATSKKDCIEEKLKLSLPDLKATYYKEKCGGYVKGFFCKEIAWVSATLGHPIAIGTITTKLLSLIKMVLIIIVFVGYTIITILSLVMLKIIFPFIILDKTRDSVISAVKFYLSTSAFVFVIKIFRFIISSATLGVVSALDGLQYTDAESFFAKSIIGTMLIVAVVVIEVGMLFATPKLTEALFDLNLKVFTKITDELKSSALLIGSVFTGGAALMAASKVIGAGQMDRLGRGASSLMNKATGGARGGGNSPQSSRASATRSSSGGSDSQGGYGRSSFGQNSSPRQPFAYGAEKEPESVVDVDDLNNQDSGASSSPEGSSGDTNNSFSESDINSNSGPSSSYDKRSFNPSSSSESKESSKPSPKSVVDKDANWSSLGASNDKSEVNNSGGDSEDNSNALTRVESNFKQPLDNKTENLPATSSGGELVSSIERDKESDDIIDAEWREISEGIETSSSESRGTNNNRNKTEKIMKAGSLVGNGLLAAYRLTSKSIKGLNRLTIAAVDAGKGDTSSIDKIKDEAMAPVITAKRRTLAKKMLEDEGLELKGNDKKIITDYLDILKEQSPSHKKKAESMIDNYEGELELKEKPKKDEDN